MYVHKFTCTECGTEILVKSEDKYYCPEPRKTHKGLTTDANAGLIKVVRLKWVGDVECGGQCIKEPPVELARAAESVDPPTTGVPKSAAMASYEYCKHPGKTRTRGTAPNTICGAMDTSRSKWKKGLNDHGKSFHSLHHALQKLLHDRVNRLENWDITNCAEIDAVDKLLKAGVEIRNIRVHSRDQFGRTKVPCENCQSWLQLVVQGGEVWRPRV